MLIFCVAHLHSFAGFCLEKAGKHYWLFVQLSFFLLQFQHTWKWTGHHPAAFLPFDNNLFLRAYTNCSEVKYLPSYMCPGTSHNIIPRKPYLLCPNLMQTRENARTNLYPFTSGPQKCTIILLENLAQPDWVNIDCHDKLLPIFFCMSQKDGMNKTEMGIEHQNNIFCSPKVVSFKQRCFAFEWVNNLTPNSKKLQNKGKVQDLTQLHQLIQVFWATRCTSQLVLTTSKADTHNSALECERHQVYPQNTLYCQTLISEEDVSGYIVYIEPRRHAPVGDNYFKCARGSSIHLESICRWHF